MHVEPDDIRRVLAQKPGPPPVAGRQAASAAEALAVAALGLKPEKVAELRIREAVECAS